MSKTEKITMFVILIFSIFGVMMFSNIIHEYSHKKDHEGIVFSDSFCFLELPGNTSLGNILYSPIASYSFKFYASDQEKVDKIDSYTEKKAYTYSILISLFWLVCFITVMYNRKKEKEVSEYG